MAKSGKKQIFFRVDLECCINFCRTAEWFSYGYAHVLLHWGFSWGGEWSPPCCPAGPCCVPAARPLAPAAHSMLPAPASPPAVGSLCLCFRFIESFACAVFQSPRITDTLRHFFLWLKWKLLSACPPRPVCCVCHSWFIVLSTALVPFHRLLFWSPVCPQTWCGTACVLGLPSPHRGHISSSGWAPSTSIWWPAARPPQARPCPLPLPPGRWSFICRGGCCPTRLSSRTRGLLGAATSSLSLQRQGNAKAWRFTLSGLWKPSPPCRRRHLGSSFHCCWVVAGSLLACLPLCSGSTRLPKLPPEWCF